MIPSELAFLGLGLLLGAAAGAALRELFHARPRAPREVRLTVTPDSVPRRIPQTLAASPFARLPAGPALDDRDVVGPGPAGPGDGAGVGVGVGAGAGDRTPVQVALDPRASGATAPRRAVGIPITPEPDGVLARVAPRSRPLPVAVAAGSRAADARAADAPAAGVTGLAVSRAGAWGAANASEVAGRGPELPPPDPCAEERRVSEERCQLAGRAKAQAAAAAHALREARRAYDDHLTRADRAAATADPRGVRQAKELAHGAFRRSRGAARTRDEVEAAARTWLQEVNRINHDAREAVTVTGRERDAANGLVTVIERLTIDADAARISFEAAAEACLVARQAVAGCDEAIAVGGAGSARPAQPPMAPEDRSDVGAPVAGEPAAANGEEAGHEAGDGPGHEAGDGVRVAAPAGEAVVLRLLRGDQHSLIRLAERLGGGDPAERRRWQLALSDLIEAIVGRAIEAAAFDFPEDHPFWSPNTRAENREIVGALGSLGYRFDGVGGFADGRVPSQRDLSLAVGYAGLDPMRIRRWPTEPELERLMGEVTVGAADYLADEAGGLSLGELVALLGHRADGLADLWNAWGRVRPLLVATNVDLAESPAPSDPEGRR